MKTQENRKEAIKEIESNFLRKMKVSGIEISDDAYCIVNENSIEIGIFEDTKINFSSCIELYAQTYNEHIGFGRRENEINFGTSGSFNPDKKGSYWRTIHAASILKNWETVCKITNHFCKMYSNLINNNSL